MAKRDKKDTIIWIIRLMVIVAGWIIGYTQFSNHTVGILIGTGAAILVILLEIIIDLVALDTMISAGVGVAIGLILAKLLEYSIFQIGDSRITGFYNSNKLLIMLICTYVCMILAIRKKDQLDLLDRNIFPTGKIKGKALMKVLDTSVIIDGRINEIGDTGFLEGTLVVPGFVLRELQAVADSSDSIKRARGRRGLEIIEKLKDNKKIVLKIFEKDYPKITEVDAKLVKLSEELGAKLITSDFNLNKVASVQGVKVLNINELSNAVKPPVLPGEELKVFVLKEGKDKKQGVAYLDDGTMVVVEDGKNFIGQKIEVTVSSILQTSAGRMIFARKGRE
jgi:uncharacterized protein YacL